MGQSRIYYRASKRLLDILIASVGLIVLAPVMALVALAIRTRIGSPVLFRHPRPGYRERTLQCLKFRTMTDERDTSGALRPDEDRLIPFGMRIRSTSLDELPQLWTVLTGEMSLVGPRPLEMRYLPRYSKEQRRRHTVKPGLTGWAQINGRNSIDWDRKLELDVWYVDHCGLLLDLKILVLTVWQVVRGCGIGQPGTSEFLGSAESRASQMQDAGVR